jgi:hypothetical protein
MTSDGLPHQVSSQTSAWRHTCCCGVRAGWDSITARGSSRTRPVLTHSARTLHCDCRGSHTVPALSTAPVHSSHHCLTYMPDAACTVCAKGTRRTSPHHHASRARSQSPPAATVRGAASRPRSTGRGACPQTAGSGRKRSSTCAAYETAGPHLSTSTARLRETPLQRRSWPHFFRPTAAQAT